MNKPLNSNFINKKNVSKYISQAKNVKEIDINIEDFYIENPKFNWKFYINSYPDLQNEGIVDETTAIYHYLKHGLNESRRTYNVVNNHKSFNYNVSFEYFLKISKQVYVSNALNMFEKRIRRKYNLVKFNNINEPSFFFGVYNNLDLEAICKLNNLRIIIWGGEDANFNLPHSLQTIKEIKNIKNCIHLAISKCIHDRLLKKNIHSICVDFNLVNLKIYKQLTIHELSNKIMISNGQTIGREAIYGESTYKQIINLRKHFDFIMTNKLNVKYENMPEVYKKCFIVLRLTQYDGNANTAQECEVLGIPIIHNQSRHGLKWKTVNDILNHIDNCFDIYVIQKNKELFNR